MPPSRGLWSAGRALQNMPKVPLASRSSARTLSSVSTISARQQNLRYGGTNPFALPVTGYVLAGNGRANLSLWPFSGGKSSTTPAPESLPETSVNATPLPTSTPSEAIHNAASSVQETTAAASTQAQSTVQEAASMVTQPTEAAQLAIEDASVSPALLENITQIGQLKELGLDYGWGPTSCVEWVVEHIHVYAGTPWYGTIILSAIAMRVLMIYPFYRMSDNQAKLQKVQPQSKEYMAEYQAAQVAGDKMSAMVARKKLSILNKQHGISMGWMIAPLVVQGVFGFGAFKLTRAMAALPVPGFETGGVAWLINLTQADPYYIAPIALGFTMHLMARWSQADINTTADPAMAKMSRPLTLYVLPSLMFLVTFWQPAALQLSFLTATIFGTAQNLLFRNAKVRSAWGMEPLVKRNAPSLTTSVSSRTMPSSGSQPATASKQDPFKENPFANLKTTARRPSGTAFASGVKYQAPTAAATLSAGPPPSAQTSPQDVVTPKDGNFVTRELKNVRQGFGSFVDGLTEKGKTMMSNQNKAGDRGRSAKFLNEARRYEEKVRAREDQARGKRNS